jgi:hypothetical protein
MKIFRWYIQYPINPRIEVTTRLSYVGPIGPEKRSCPKCVLRFGSRNLLNGPVQYMKIEFIPKTSNGSDHLL